MFVATTILMGIFTFVPRIKFLILPCFFVQIMEVAAVFHFHELEKEAFMNERKLKKAMSLKKELKDLFTNERTRSFSCKNSVFEFWYAERNGNLNKKAVLIDGFEVKIALNEQVRNVTVNILDNEIVVKIPSNACVEEVR